MWRTARIRVLKASLLLSHKCQSDTLVLKSGDMDDTISQRRESTTGQDQSNTQSKTAHKAYQDRQ